MGNNKSNDLNENKQFIPNDNYQEAKINDDIKENKKARRTLDKCKEIVYVAKKENQIDETKYHQVTWSA